MNPWLLKGVSVFPKTVAFWKFKYGVNQDTRSTFFHFLMKFRQCPVKGNSHVPTMIGMFRAKRDGKQEIAITCEQGSLRNGSRTFAWQLYLSQIQQFEMVSPFPSVIYPKTGSHAL